MSDTADTVLYTGTDATTAVSYSAGDFRVGVGAWLARKDATHGLQARSGVLSPDALAVTQTATASMTVNVAAGPIAVQGTTSGTQGAYTAIFLAGSTVTAEDSDAGADRLDLVQIRVYDVDDGQVVAGGPDYGGQITIKKGVASGTPELPVVDDDAVALAQISVGALVTEITDDDITDLRPRAVALGGILPCTSTTRPAHQAGLVIYETDTANLLVSDGTAWSAPDNSPQGTLGYNEVVAEQDSITTETDLTGLSVTVTVGAGRRIRISAYASVSSTVAGDRYDLRVKEGATVLQQYLETVELALVASSTAHPVVIKTPTSGSHTYKVSLQRVTGTGTLTLAAGATVPCYILVEDIGV